MTKIDDYTRLIHIKQAIEEALGYIEGKTRQDLETEKVIYRSLERLIEIVGEAANGVSETKQKEYPNIPWQEMRGMRNRIAHTYFAVDKETVWLTVKDDFPILLAEVNKILKATESE